MLEPALRRRAHGFAPVAARRAPVRAPGRAALPFRAAGRGRRNPLAGRAGLGVRRRAAAGRLVRAGALPRTRTWRPLRVPGGRGAAAARPADPLRRLAAARAGAGMSDGG